MTERIPVIERNPLNIEALREYTEPTIRNTDDWWDQHTDEEKEVLYDVLRNNSVPTALAAFKEHANYPFSLTALKMFRNKIGLDPK